MLEPIRMLISLLLVFLVSAEGEQKTAKSADAKHSEDCEGLLNAHYNLVEEANSKIETLNKELHEASFKIETLDKELQNTKKIYESKLRNMDAELQRCLKIQISGVIVLITPEIWIFKKKISKDDNTQNILEQQRQVLLEAPINSKYV